MVLRCAGNGCRCVRGQVHFDDSFGITSLVLYFRFTYSGRNDSEFALQWDRGAFSHLRDELPDGFSRAATSLHVDNPVGVLFADRKRTASKSLASSFVKEPSCWHVRGGIAKDATR